VRCSDGYGTEAFTQDSNVVGVDPRVLGSAGYGDVGEAGIEQVRVDGCIGIN
jgi:hypothetical protein